MVTKRDVRLKAKTIVTLGIAFSNNGDGSVSARLFKTLEEAKAWEEKEAATQGESWGEPCAEELELCFDDQEVLMGYDEEGREIY